MEDTGQREANEAWALDDAEADASQAPEVVNVDGPVQPRYIGLAPLPSDLAEELERKYGRRKDSAQPTIHVLDSPNLSPDDAVGYILGHMPEDKSEPETADPIWRLPNKLWE